MEWDGKLIILGAEGANASKDACGNKGYNLHRMMQWGVRVPRAVCIPAAACRDMRNDPEGVEAKVKAVLPSAVRALTVKSKRAQSYVPLVSVRSSAAVSMPGMMDTILNVGLDSASYPFWKKRLGESAVEYCACMLVKMYGASVDGLAASLFSDCGDNPDKHLFRYFNAAHAEFPSAEGQLFGAVMAVLKSWNTPRAIEYRRMNSIPEELGTAVVIQEMVFGNLEKDSCTGVLFTRNPYTGDNAIVGEFLMGHQGEVVVSGEKTGLPLTEFKKYFGRSHAAELWQQVHALEDNAGYPQEVEFTVQLGETFILQTRDIKPQPAAAIRIALDLRTEGNWTLDDVFANITFKQYVRASSASVANYAPQADAIGVAGSAGVACGVVVTTEADALKCSEPCILVRPETCPDDIKGMAAAVGILTKRGGFTCHAAVVARGMNKVCVVGCDELEFNGEIVYLGNVPLNGQKVTLDGLTGRVWISDGIPMNASGSADAAKLYALAKYRYPHAELLAGPVESDSSEAATKTAVFNLAAFGRKHPEAPLLTALQKVLAIPYKHLIIDVSAPEEDLILDMFGDDLPQFISCSRDDVLFYLSSQGKFAAKRVSVVGLVKGEVIGGGIETVGSVSTLSELLAVEGLVSLNMDALLEQMTIEDMQMVARLKREAGQTLQSFSTLRGVPPSVWPRESIVACSALNFMEVVLS